MARNEVQRDFCSSYDFNEPLRSKNYCTIRDKTIYVRSMKDSDTFLTMSGIRESDTLYAVGDEYISIIMSTSKIQVSDFPRSSLYALRHV